MPYFAQTTRTNLSHITTLKRQQAITKFKKGIKNIKQSSKKNRAENKLGFRDTRTEVFSCCQYLYTVRKGVRKIERLPLEGGEGGMGKEHVRNQRGVRILLLEGGKGNQHVRNKREGNQGVVIMGF